MADDKQAQSGVRVRYVPAVTVDGATHAPDTYETTVTKETADELVKVGRAFLIGEPLKLTDEERAALPALPSAKVGEEPTIGKSDSPRAVEPAAPSAAAPSPAPNPAPSPAPAAPKG